MAAATLAVLACLPASPALAGPSSFQTGVSGVYEFDPVSLSQVKGSGAEFMRVVISWRAIAPETEPKSWNPSDPGDPNYNWSGLDETVRHVVAAGLKPLALVTEAPKWAEGCTSSGSSFSAVCDPDASAFAAFAHAAAARFTGAYRGLPSIRYWEPINEPNLSLFFNPQFSGGKPVSPTLYRRLLNGFYASVHAVQPKNVVIGGALGPIAVPKYTVGPEQFTRELLCMKGPNKKPRKGPGKCEGGVHMDAYDIHPYTTGSPTHRGGPNDVELGDLPKLQRLLAAAKRAGRIHGKFGKSSLWITEFSWDSKPPDPGGLPMAIEKRWVPEAMYQAWKAGVAHFFWYSLRDEPLRKPTSESIQSGLYFLGATPATSKPKPYLKAFQFPFVAYPGNHLSFWGVTPSRHAGKVAIQAQVGKRWQTLRVLQAGKHGIFTGSIGSGYGRDQKGAVRAVIGKTASVPFAMKPVPDFAQPPFG